MPPVQKKSSFVGKYAQELRKAHDAHKSDETEYSGFSSLPGGIENGIAQLVECEIFQVKEGKKMQGEYCFRAVGIVQKPVEFEGIPIKGMRTTIMEMLCNTPDSGGDRKTFADHWAYFLNELRKLGLDTSTMDVSSDDAITASLDMLVGVGPYFWYRTWQPPTPKEGPYKDKKPQVVHMWNGTAEAYVPEDASSGVEDNTSQGNGQQRVQQTPTPQPSTTPQKTRTTQQPTSPPKAPTTQAKPPASPSAKTTQQARQPATQFNKTIPNDIDPHTEAAQTTQIEELPDDLDTLAELAKNSDNAQQKLCDLAREAGVTEQQIDNAKVWTEVVELMRSIQQSSDETTTEGEHPESEEFLPKTNEVWNYRPLDPKRGNKPSNTPVACKVTKVDIKSKTVTLENLEDSRKTYTKVPFDSLEGSEE